MALAPSHLSRHFDDIKLNRSSLGLPADIICQQMHDRVLAETGYAIKIATKVKWFSLELLKSLAHGHSDIDTDPVMSRPGNCILASVDHNGLSRANLRSLVRQDNDGNRASNVYCSHLQRM